MASTHIKPLVLVFGATGRTGRSVVQGLLDSGNFRVAIITRSTENPTIANFARANVVIHTLDVVTATADEVQRALKGVNILISVAPADNIAIQRPLFAAAAAAGVERVVPSAFATPCPPGGMDLHDQKLEILEYIKTLGLSWTWIDVGWWMQISLPYPPDLVTHPVASQFYRVMGTGNVPFAVSDLDDVGRIVARIVSDERTRDRFVFAYAEEVTQTQIWRLVEEIAPNPNKLTERKVQVSNDELIQTAKNAAATYAKEKTSENKLSFSWSEYMVSIFVDGHNTSGKAKELGELDFKELYPNFKFNSLREYAERFYSDPKDSISS